MGKNDEQKTTASVENEKLAPYLRKKRPEMPKPGPPPTVPISGANNTTDIVKKNINNIKNSKKEEMQPPLVSDSSSEIFNNASASKFNSDSQGNFKSASLNNFNKASGNNSKPTSKQQARSNLVSRDSNISNLNLAELIALDPDLLKGNNEQQALTPILDEFDIKVDDDAKSKASGSDKTKKKTKTETNKKSAKSQSKFSSINNGAKTGAEIAGRDKNDANVKSYAEQYYKTNTYLSTWRDKYQERAKELDPSFGRVNSPQEREQGYSKSVARSRFRVKNYEDMHFFNPITEALIKPYYGRQAFAHSDDFFTHNKLLQQWKEEKKEFIRQQKEPTIHEMLYALREKPKESYLDKLAEQKWKLLNGATLPPNGSRYTVEDYRNLKKNWGFGNVFGKIKNFDSETKAEKLEKVHKRMDAGNKFMKVYTNRVHSRDGSKTPTQEEPAVKSPRDTLPAINNDKSTYYEGYLKQLNDKNHIKIHHPVLKNTGIKYESKKKSKKVNKKIQTASLPPLTTDSTTNTTDININNPSEKSDITSESTTKEDYPLLHRRQQFNDDFNLPEISTATQSYETFNTQRDHQPREMNSRDSQTSTMMMQTTHRNDNLSILKLQYLESKPNSRSKDVTNYINSSRNNNNNNNSNKSRSVETQQRNALNSNDGLNRRSLHNLPARISEDGQPHTTRSSPGSWGAQPSPDDVSLRNYELKHGHKKRNGEKLFKNPRFKFDKKPVVVKDPKENPRARALNYAKTVEEKMPM